MNTTQWDRRWFGYWRGKSSTASELPCIDEFTDPEWCPSDKDKLLRYLDDAPVIMTWWASGTCLVCGCDVGNMSKHHSDGVWVWHGSLPHYVREHAVVLPQAFVDYIRSREYSLPAQDEVDWASLDWPKGDRIPPGGDDEER